MTKRPKTRMHALAAGLAGASLVTGLALASSGASAQTAAYTSEPVELYAGPSGDYPVVSELGPGVPVTVMGCVSDYSWCDVTVPGLRGWVYGGYLSYPYEGSYVPLTNYGAAIGLPIVTFSLGAYWGSFYRDRPWYGEQGRWAHVPPPERGRPSAPPAWHGAPGRPAWPNMPERGGPPQGAERPPVRPEAPRPPGNLPPPGAGRPPVNAEPPRAPANMAPLNAERPHEAGRPPAPEPQQFGGRPPAGAPAQGFAHPQGGMRPPGPAPAEGRPPAPPQGGHPSGQGGGRGDDRQHEH
ncbi:SH3 domain-containing protein [Paraburkholderia lycopersici]|uniref:Uncharacterized conserved protein YraI n=1 Tax=Paraburkholderia lycopersici TaxID=416944 RepID=A0A1G7AGW0_9BURK|nr:SH3 domain-containing protein [Paraburkholderia lycopersici]SDE14061.1 Uncharacterized conserved protein YraI [Paraburkholderia lycopersici]